MKKVILTALLLAAFSSSALAFDALTGTTTIGSLKFATSNNVYVAGDSATSGYVLQSLHTSGSRVFTTDSAESKLYWKDVAISISSGTVTGFDTSLIAPTASGVHGTPDVADMGTPL